MDTPDNHSGENSGEGEPDSFYYELWGIDGTEVNMRDESEVEHFTNTITPIRKPEEELIADFKWSEDLPCHPHPLLIPHVVKKIIEMIPPADVEKCRLVNRVWNEEASSVLQNKKIVALMDNDALKFYMDKMGETVFYPYSGYELYLENITDLDLVQKFWTTFGHSIKFLDLRQKSTMPVEALFEILRDHLPNLVKLALNVIPKRLVAVRRPPQLEDLDFEEHLEEIEQVGAPVPPILHGDWHVDAAAAAAARRGHRAERGVLPEGVVAYAAAWRAERAGVPPDDATLSRLEQSRFPNIKELALCWCNAYDANSVNILKTVMQSMPNLERLSFTKHIGSGVADGAINRTRLCQMIVKVLANDTVHFPHLEKVEFPMEIGPSELTHLASHPSRFTHLDLKLTDGTKSSELKKFLDSVSGTMQALKLEFPDSFFNGRIRFPAFSQMKNNEIGAHLRELRELTLKNFAGPVEPLKYLKKLKRLVIHSAKGGIFHPSEPMFHAHDDHQMKYFQSDVIVDPASIISLCLSFPLLRTIKVTGLDDTALGVIYRNLPFLNELEVLRGTVTDKGISGVPMEVCKDMADTNTYHFVDPSRFRQDLFIGSLQFLKTLKLNSNELTDMSVIFGIVDCKNLESLTLACEKITDVGMNKIADKMVHQLQYFDIHECTAVTEFGKYYVKEKMRNCDIVFESSNFVKDKNSDNPYRQVGYPCRGRAALFRIEGPPGPVDVDDLDELMPLRERVMVAMERRRRMLGMRRRAERLLLA